MGSFDDLGRALRWTRQRQGKKQYEVATAARITKAMLSSYENGKQRPTLETLERILGALGIDLDSLAYAIRAVRHEKSTGKRPGAPPSEPTTARPATSVPALDTYPYDGLALQQLLRLPRSLDPAEERAVGEMIQGFHALMRYFLSRSEQFAEAVADDPEEPESPAAAPSERRK